MIRYEEILPEVIPYVQECPEVVAVNAIRNAVIEFCDKSLWLLHEHDPISLNAYQGLYELSLPDDTMSARILDAWFRNLPMAPRGEDDLKRIYPFSWRKMEGRPQFYTQLDPGEVYFVPMPIVDYEDAVHMIVALKPTRNSVSCDDTLYERWAEKIGYGARARIHEIPGQTFSDPALALLNRARFSSAIGEAKVERNRGMTRINQRIRAPRLV